LVEQFRRHPDAVLAQRPEVCGTAWRARGLWDRGASL
jgi:hypothetical protein